MAMPLGRMNSPGAVPRAPMVRSISPVSASNTSRRWLVLAVATTQTAPSSVGQVASESSSAPGCSAPTYASVTGVGGGEGRAGETGAGGLVVAQPARSSNGISGRKAFIAVDYDRRCRLREVAVATTHRFIGMKRLTGGKTAGNLRAPSRPAEGQARRSRGNLMAGAQAPAVAVPSPAGT